MSATNFVAAVVAKQLATWPFPLPTPVELPAAMTVTTPANDTGAEARMYGINICHAFYPSIDDKTGVTIAYRKENDYNNCRMVEVAVSYCSPHDTFRRKIGARNALEKFLNGETIMVPARDPGRGGDDSIVTNLRNMFYWSI